MASFLQRNFFPSVCAFVIAVFATTLPAMAALHEGDTLLVTVFNHPELSREVKIDAAGNVSLPLAGSVSARGAEVGQVAERVRRALVPYVIMPAVQVTLSSQASSIFISGNGGGVLVYQPEETLAAALADAQKLQSSGDLRLASQAALQRMNIDFHRVMVRRDGNVL
jgi:protein involved in polysaccharide export with SLBB domain